ncbi:hypothetical protein D3C78_1391220 [compost metagenome]
MAGISRIHLVKAHSIMQPVTEFTASRPHCDIRTLLRASPEADIGALIDLTMQSDQDAVAVFEKDAVIGIVTARDLLRGVAGTPAEQSAAA